MDTIWTQKSGNRQSAEFSRITCWHPPNTAQPALPMKPDAAAAATITATAPKRKQSRWEKRKKDETSGWRWCHACSCMLKDVDLFKACSYSTSGTTALLSPFWRCWHFFRSSTSRALSKPLQARSHQHLCRTEKILQRPHWCHSNCLCVTSCLL